MAFKYLISAIATTILGLIFNRTFLNDISSTSFGQLLFEIMILIISFTLPNIIFLWSMAKLKVIGNTFFKVPIILLEALSLYCIFYFINLLIEQLPRTILFAESSTNLSKRVYFDFYFQIGYSFIILFLILLLYKRKSL
jgi:hypothetical protein